MPENSIVVAGTDWLYVIAISVASMAWNAIKRFTRNLIELHPWSLVEAAKANDTDKLQDLLVRLPLKSPSPEAFKLQFLEYEDVITGFTALMTAASAGHSECVRQLLGAGSSVGHADRWGRTALHLACEHAHLPVVQLLLHANADPFVEDCKGYTALDFALKLDSSRADNVTIVRMIQQRGRFCGWLSMKVVRFAGFRRVWEKRWCLISPRRRNRRLYPDDAPSAYTLLTWFRDPADFTVYGKAWLNGSEVKMEEHGSQPEVQLTLQRNHERPSDAFVVTDTAGRHSLFLRAADSTSAALQSLRTALPLLGRNRESAQPQRPQAQAQPQPQQQRQQPPPSAAAAVVGGHRRQYSIAEDEALARRLQEEEYACANSASAAASQAPNASALTGSSSSRPLCPWQMGREGPLADGAGDLPSRQETAAVAQPAAGSAAAKAASSEASLYPDLTDPAPRPSAPPMVPQPSAASNGQAEENLCVVCQESEASCGFLHGSSVHKCICRTCATLYQQSNAPKTCPMCRQDIQQVITDIF